MHELIPPGSPDDMHGHCAPDTSDLFHGVKVRKRIRIAGRFLVFVALGRYLASWGLTEAVFLPEKLVRGLKFEGGNVQYD
jgi:hypothetical protein